MNFDMLETLDFWLEILRTAETLEVRTKKVHYAETVRVIIKANSSIPYMVGSELEIKIDTDTRETNKGRIRLLHTPEKYRNTPEGRYLKKPYEEYVKGNTFYTGVSSLAGCLFIGFLKKAAEYSKLPELEKAIALFESCNK